MHRMLKSLCCALLIGCGSSNNAPADLSMNGDMAAPPSIPWTASVVDIQTRSALSGVKVCVAPGNQVCAQTDTVGQATLMVPQNAQFMLSYTLAGYPPQYTEHSSTTNVNSSGYLLVSATVEGTLASAVSQQLDPSKANLVFSAVDINYAPLAGVTFAATPTAGAGPYYFGSSSGLPDANATATNSNGLGFVLNVPAGDYDVTATLTGKSCAGAPDKSWPGNTAASAKSRAIAGAITTISIMCK